MTLGILEMVGIMSLVLLGIITIPLVIGLLYVEIRDIVKYWYKIGKGIRRKMEEKSK